MTAALGTLVWKARHEEGVGGYRGKCTAREEQRERERERERDIDTAADRKRGGVGGEPVAASQSGHKRG